MPAPNKSTYDNGNRPTPSDFNGISLTNDPQFPPDPASQPTAELFNTWSFLLISAGKAVGVAGFAVNAGPSPSIASWWTAANLIASNPFNLVRNGVGDYSITWAANLFPIAGWPRAELNQLPISSTACIGAVNVTNGVRVQTTQGGALTDLPFSIEVF
jgi:hypothetical protein